jgi:hypothetical protein
MFFKNKSVCEIQGQVIIMHELDSSTPWQNTAQFQHLPVESWRVGRPVSTGAARAAWTRAFQHERAIYIRVGLLVAEECPISGLRLRVALHNMT